MVAAALLSASLTICGMNVPVPAAEPPPGAAPVLLSLMLCFEKQGGTSVVEPQTYLYYVRATPSEPSRGRWVAFTDDTREVLLEDFRRLWATNFLDDLSIAVHDYTFSNGVIGKIVVFDMEERQRVKLVEYDGAIALSRSDINDRLKEKGIDLRLDSFLDSGVLRRVSTAVRELYAEKGYQFAIVAPEVTALPGGPKLARVRFAISEGPKVAIRDVEFIGNRAFSDRELSRVLKATRPQSVLSLVTHSGTYSEDGFAEDAEGLVRHYRRHGYVTARVGQPTVRELDDSADSRTRWIQLRVEVAEGAQYRLGEMRFEGQTVVSADAFRSLFALEPGDIYDEERVSKGLERAREIYGAAGYFEFTAFPELQPRSSGEPVVDVTLRISEGKQYLVNRITFTGNTQTHDRVIRREMSLVEGGVFNTEALKYSIRRINQLGYFLPLDDKAVAVDRTADADNQVDVNLKVEEQNRNQLNFGAGVSQYEGLFANFSYTTANFLGRGESATVSIQSGTRASTYQVSFSEPFLFDKPITAGTSLYSRKVDFSIASDSIDYSEVRSGLTLTSGVPIGQFTRAYVTYGYEVTDTAMTEDLRRSLQSGSTSPFLVNGSFHESSVTPALVHNTVDNPFAPRSGRRLSGSAQLAGGWLGGTIDYVKPEVQVIWYVPVTRRTALGMRSQYGQIWNRGGRELPYYQRYFLGGETQIRGVDLRSVGPVNENGVALGGTKFALFNVEYYYDILPQVRALAFHDAGQAFSEQQRINLLQMRTSSGVELRVTLPVLNVPFRLIYAWNVYRDASQPARTFKFAVGTTF